MSSQVSLSCVTNEKNDTNCIDSFQTTFSDPCGINASMCRVKIWCLHIITTSTDLLHKSPRLEWFLRQRVETKTRLKFAWAWDWVSGGWDLWFNFRLLLTNFQFCFPLENCSPANLNIYQSQSPIISHRRICIFKKDFPPVEFLKTQPHEYLEFKHPDRSFANLRQYQILQILLSIDTQHISEWLSQYLLSTPALML